jgi:hypothetical protein
MRTCSCIILEDGGGDGVAGTDLKGTTGNNQCKLYKFGIEVKWKLATYHPVFVVPALSQMTVGMMKLLGLTYKELQKLTSVSFMNLVLKLEWKLATYHSVYVVPTLSQMMVEVMASLGLMYKELS